MTPLTWSNDRRGATMLYIVGALAVMLILVYGLSDSILQTNKRANALRDEAQAKWIARAGVAYAKAKARDVQTSASVTVECAGGQFSVKMTDGTTSGAEIVSTGRYPMPRPRAESTVVGRL